MQVTTFTATNPSRTKVACLVDTTIFNQLVKGQLDPSCLPDGFYFATHVQRDELTKTRDPALRARLLEKFESLVDGIAPTESLALGVSRLGGCKVSDGVLAKAIQADLDLLNGGKRNNVQDTLIMETAIVNRFALVTGDYHMAKVAKEHGGTVLYFRTPDA